MNLDGMVWEPQRLHWHGLTFTLDPRADGAMDLVLWKTAALVAEYQAFWAREPGFTADHVFEIGLWKGGSRARHRERRTLIMAFAKTFNARNLNEELKASRTLLAAYKEILARVDADLAGEDMRPVGGELQAQRNQTLGLPVDMTRFDQAAAEGVRETLIQQLEDAHGDALATSRR